MKTITITVKASDIKLGKRSTPCECPLARAIQRATKSEELGVFRDGVGYTIPNPWGGTRQYDHSRGLAYHLTKKALRFMNRFDGGYEVKPGVFRLKAIA